MVTGNFFAEDATLIQMKNLRLLFKEIWWKPNGSILAKRQLYLIIWGI